MLGFEGIGVIGVGIGAGIEGIGVNGVGIGAGIEVVAEELGCELCGGRT